MIPTLARKFRSAFERPFFYVVVLQILLSPMLFWAAVSIEDSTDYFLQEVSSAVKDDKGNDVIYVGDDLQIKAYNWRHKSMSMWNGRCWIWVDRVRENVGGKHAGKKTVIQGLPQEFVGDGIIRRTTWPIAPARIQVSEQWFDDPDAEEQPMDIYTTGWFECNPYDKLRAYIGWPRMHHNGEGLPERERTRVILRRKPAT